MGCLPQSVLNNNLTSWVHKYFEELSYLQHLVYSIRFSHWTAWCRHRVDSRSSTVPSISVWSTSTPLTGTQSQGCRTDAVKSLLDCVPIHRISHREPLPARILVWTSLTDHPVTENVTTIKFPLKHKNSIFLSLYKPQLSLNVFYRMTLVTCFYIMDIASLIHIPPHHFLQVRVQREIFQQTFNLTLSPFLAKRFAQTPCYYETETINPRPCWLCNMDLSFEFGTVHCQFLGMNIKGLGWAAGSMEPGWTIHKCSLAWLYAGAIAILGRHPTPLLQVTRLSPNFSSQWLAHFGEDR